MFDEMKYILLHSSGDNAIVNFTTVAFCPYTHSKMLSPLISCIVNSALVHNMPDVQQTLLQFVNAVQLRLMHLLLDVAPYLVIDRIKVGAIRWPQIWKNYSGC